MANTNGDAVTDLVVSNGPNGMPVVFLEGGYIGLGKFLKVVDATASPTRGANARGPHKQEDCQSGDRGKQPSSQGQHQTEGGCNDDTK